MDGNARFRKGNLSSNGKAINTVIGRGSVSDGKFRVETGVRVDGTLRGELESSGTLIVGESGVIEANVHVRDALVSGRIVGTLEASEKVHLQGQAVFIGNLKARVLVVEEGAVFKAECDAGGEIAAGRHGDVRPRLPAQPVDDADRPAESSIGGV